MMHMIHIHKIIIFNFQKWSCFVKDIDVLASSTTYRVHVDVDETNKLVNKKKGFLDIVLTKYIYSDFKDGFIAKNKGAKSGDCPYLFVAGTVPNPFTMTVSTRYNLKLYCGYKYTRPCMFNHTWPCTQYSFKAVFWRSKQLT